VPFVSGTVSGVGNIWLVNGAVVSLSVFEAATFVLGGLIMSGDQPLPTRGTPVIPHRLRSNIIPSIGAAYQANFNEMVVSQKSVYNKLNGIEPQVSEGLVEDSVLQFAPVIEKLRATLPPLLPGYHTKILDGNHFSATR